MSNTPPCHHGGLPECISSCVIGAAFLSEFQTSKTGEGWESDETFGSAVTVCPTYLGNDHESFNTKA